MFLIITFLITLFFLLGTFFLTALSTAFRRMRKRDSKQELLSSGRWFFYRSFHSKFFPTYEYEGLYFAIVCAQNVARCCYVIAATVFLLSTPLFHTVEAQGQIPAHYDFSTFWISLLTIAFLVFSFIFGEYIPRILGLQFPDKVLKICPPFCSIFLFLVFPITFLFLKVSNSFSRTVYLDHLHEPQAQAKQEIIDLIQDTELTSGINRHDKKLIESVLLFREKIAREVMVPRVDLFSLPGETSIKDAAKLLAREGYSRTPIYKDTIDEVIGVLMYKDILAKYMEYEQQGNDKSILEASVETIKKPVLYTPETKKISNLLQEFRKKQVHLAIVVDEYGGTEGIVTIEDILEEIVGDIEDEYDEEETLFHAQPDGSWIVDARMSIFDIEDQLGISITQEGEYDTIGGYIFDYAGSIPSKGFTIHQDDFDIEVIASSDRVLEKVKIKPTSKVSKLADDEVNDEH